MTIAGLALGVLTASVPAAGADFHIMKIREISGATGDTGGGYLELQMWAQGQSNVSGHLVDFYDADADGDGPGGQDAPNPLDTCTIPSDVANGQNQRTVLLGENSAAAGVTLDGICPEFNYLDTGVPNNIVAGGAICFNEASPPDCASWGSFTAASLMLDQATASPNPLPTDTSALKRKITPGCPTLLELGDDTNSTATDFEEVARDPTPNATAPVETECMGMPPISSPAGDSATPAKPRCKKGQKLVKGKCRKKKRKKKR